MMNHEEYDYVIVGAGASSMGLVNGLLSSFKETSPSFTVAVLERGSGPPYAAATETPNQWCHASHRPSRCVKLTNSLIGNRVIDIPVGQGLGGTTNINACLCCPPARDDFESWPEPWNEAIMNSVHVVQDVMLANDALYHYNSELESCKIQGSVQRQVKFPSLVTSVPLSAAKRDGVSSDLSGQFVRRNYYDSLVAPLLRDYPNLQDRITFHTDFQVERLLFSEDNVRVIGVEGPRRIFAQREVILCAGAIESPALLLVSGIGHDQDLQKAAILSRQEESCAGVGRRLRDHVLLPRVFLSFRRTLPDELSPNGVYRLVYNEQGDDRFQYIFNDAAVYSQLIPHFVASFVRRQVTRGPTLVVSIANWIINGLFLFCRTLLSLLLWCTYTPLFYILRHHVVTMNVALLNPKSTGTVSIRRREDSNETTEPIGRSDVDIVVDTGYLSDTRDVVALFQGWISSSKRLHKRWIEVLPGFLFGGFLRNDSTDPTWFRRYASHFALPYFHWCGTCAIKTDSNTEWVVDSRLRVRNIAGLRVCDASVFPTMISGPTALTCAALGHVLATILLDANDKKNS